MGLPFNYFTFQFEVDGCRERGFLAQAVHLPLLLVIYKE